MTKEIEKQANGNGKRVAIIYRTIGNIGGTNNTIGSHARRLTELGYEVDLIGEKLSKTIAPEIGHPIRIRRVPILSRYKYRWFSWHAQRRINKIGYHFVAGHGHHAGRQDVLSMHNCSHLLHELTATGALDTRGTAVEIHDQILKAKRFTLCIANSQFMKSDLMNRYQLGDESFRVIYPGYDEQKFNLKDRAYYRGKVRAELGGGDKVVIGLLTSGDWKNRGLDILIDALAALPEVLRRKCLLVIVGKSAGLAPYHKQIQARGISNQVLFAGSTSEPQRYLHALDICAHPAHIETFGQGVQEALICGVPVVTNRGVGATELFPHSIKQALPEKPGVDTLTEQLATVIQLTPDERYNIAMLGRKSFVGNTLNRNLDQTMAAYKDCGL